MSRSPSRHLLALLAGLAALAGPAVLLASADPTYAALRAARPDGRTVAVHGLVLERDAFRFEFASGSFHFLAPVAGRTVGAVFVGEGSYRLLPASETERRHLVLTAGENLEALGDRFDRLVLLFTDDTAGEISRAAPVVAGAPDAQAVAAYETHLKRQRRDFLTNFHLRILRDLLNRPDPSHPPAGGVFLAFVDGKRFPPALAAFDPEGVEGLAIAQMMGGDTTVFYVADAQKGGVWYSSPSKADAAAGRTPPAAALAEAQSYRIATAVSKSADIAGTAAIDLRVLAPGLRVLPLHLMAKLRLQSASFVPAGAGAAAAPAAVAFVQEDEREDADPAVIFPRPLAAGEEVELRLAYQGTDVLTDAGDKNFVVGARESWYPNLGTFTDPAVFELTYRVPAGNDIVSVGRQVEARTEGKENVSVWRTDGPVRVAGFNYGRFKKLARKDGPSGLEIAVYTNPGTPDALRAINSALSAVGRMDIGTIDPDALALPQVNESLGKIDTGRLAESALADGINSARVFTAYFGPLGAAEVAITQQSQWSFGQSWPSLIFLPYLSFLDGTQRRQLGLSAAKDFVDEVGFHEFAHQWWGHRVGWSSYRDLWLSEGFAEFSAGLAIQHTQGWGAYDRFFRNRRQEILERVPGSAASYEAGPIALGSRLDTARSAGAVPAIVYAKGAYVLHMLRMLMWDPAAKNPDGPFIAMMRDYAATYAGKSPSTADFQAVVERHMTPALNATGNGRMDWFFDQWVASTAIPRYTSDLAISPQGDGWKISGRVSQQGVGKGFRALVPLYVELGKNELAKVGMLPMVGEMTRPIELVVKLPKKPRRALLNARGEVLARD